VVSIAIGHLHVGKAVPPTHVVTPDQMAFVKCLPVFGEEYIWQLVLQGKARIGHLFLRSPLGNAR